MPSQSKSGEIVGHFEYMAGSLRAKKDVNLTVEGTDRADAMVKQTEIESTTQSLNLAAAGKVAEVSYSSSSMTAAQGNINFGVHGGDDAQSHLPPRKKGAADVPAGPKSVITFMKGVTLDELQGMSLDELVDLYTQYRDAFPGNPLATIKPPMVKMMGENGARNFLASLLPPHMRKPF